MGALNIGRSHTLRTAGDSSLRSKLYLGTLALLSLLPFNKLGIDLLCKRHGVPGVGCVS